MNKLATDSTQDSRAIISASLRRRHARSKNFRRMGAAAILFASAMLIWLLLSIIPSGISGFMRHEVRIESLATDRARALTSEGEINMTRLLHLGLDRTLEQVGVNGSALTPRARYVLLGDFAGFAVQDAWKISEKNAVGVQVFVPLADVADHYLKYPSNSSSALSAAQHNLLDTLKEQGAIRRTINPDFFTRGDSRAPESAGFLGSVIGSLLLVFVAIAVALPISVMAAIYLEEFAKKNLVSDMIEVSIANLAAVPSIIFGLLGLTLYLIWWDMPRSSALVGGLTLALMVLPTLIIATRAALKAVPQSVRLAAIALGATPLQVVKHHVLPYATSGIMTGTILSVARVLGETAPLLMIGMVAFVADIPRGLTDPATSMPVTIYLWASSPESGFVEKTASGILILLVILMALNTVAIRIRNKFELRW
jgi:phosphate transport system permease protein